LRTAKWPTSPLPATVAAVTGPRLDDVRGIIGKSLEELRTWDKEDILDLLGIEVGPVRLSAALLPLKAMKAPLGGAWARMRLGS